MMVDLQQVIESLIDHQTRQSREIDQLKRDLKGALDQIASLRATSSVTSKDAS